MRLRDSKFLRKPPQPAISGSLDKVSDGKCYGWVTIEGGDAPLEVTITVDSAAVASGTADQFRRDLEEAGRGNCAFVVDLPDLARDGLFHRVAAVANGRVFASVDEVQLLPKLTPAQFDKDAPWFDAGDAAFEIALERSIARGRIREELVPDMRFFREQGYLHLRSAIATELIDRVLDDVEQSWEMLPEHLTVLNSSLRAPTPIRKVAQMERFRGSSYRYLDFHNWSEAAAEIMMHPRVLELVGGYLNSSVVGMQSLLFENGTEQRCHQDFAFVHSLKPALLAGAWVALEDVHPDGGPLFYYPGSHRRVPKYVFENGTVLAEGDGAHVRRFEEYLQEECERAGLRRTEFMPKKGDVLIWHSALVHGGAPRANRALTRKSMVSHYSTLEAYPFDRRHPAAKPITIERNGASYYALRRDGHCEAMFAIER